MERWFSLSIIHDFSWPEATTGELNRCIQVPASSGSFKTSPLWPALRVPTDHGLEAVFSLQTCRPDWLNCQTFYLRLKCLFPTLTTSLSFLASMSCLNLIVGRSIIILIMIILSCGVSSNSGRENGFCSFRNKITTAIADINKSYNFVSEEQHMVLYAELKLGQLVSMFIISFKMRFMLGQRILLCLLSHGIVGLYNS